MRPWQGWISIHGDTYDELQQYCLEHQISVTSLVESLLTDISGSDAKPKRDVRKPRCRRGAWSVELSAELVARIDDYLIDTYPPSRRPTKRWWLDKLLGGSHGR